MTQLDRCCIWFQAACFFLPQVESGKEGEGDNAQPQANSLYMALKGLQKNAVRDITLTGHDVTITQEDGKHGFQITPEQGKSFSFFVTQKTAPKQHSSGNALRNLILSGKDVAPQFAWLWRCSFETTHCRVIPKKPFLTVATDLRLEADRPVQVHL